MKVILQQLILHLMHSFTHCINYNYERLTCTQSKSCDIHSGCNSKNDVAKKPRAFTGEAGEITSSNGVAWPWLPAQSSIRELLALYSRKSAPRFGPLFPDAFRGQYIYVKALWLPTIYH